MSQITLFVSGGSRDSNPGSLNPRLGHLLILQTGGEGGFPKVTQQVGG